MDTYEFKRELADLAIAALETERDGALQGEKYSKEEAASHVGAMESRYDTFKEEAQYLAAGHLRRRVEIEQWLHELRRFKDDARCVSPTNKVRLGALVKIQDYATNECRIYFLVPAGGGNAFQVDDESVTTLNVASPLAQSMILKDAGDEATLHTKGGDKTLLILSVR